MATLGLGDIAFTGYQASTTDKVSLVLLKAVDSGTIVTVTDNAWTGSALTINEGNSVITFSGSFAAGTQLNFDASRTAGLRWANGATTTNLSDATGGNFSLNSTGDNLFAYNGSTAPTAGNGVAWVSAFATNAFLATGVQTTSLTYLPSIFASTNSQFSLGLTNGASNQNGAYVGGNVTGNASQIRNNIYTAGNWSTFTTAGGQAIPPVATFSLQGTSNSAPTGMSLSNSSIYENAGSNAVVGAFSTTDPNAGDTFVYSLVSGTGSTHNTSFNISGNSLRASSSFDFETQNSYSIRVRTTDQGSLFFEQVFTISVVNLNETLDVRLNELKVNPPGSTTSGDKYQYIELKGTAGLSLNNVYVVMIDGNGNASGTASYVQNLSSYSLGSNGLLMIKSPTGGHTAPSETTVVTNSLFDTAGGILNKLSVSFQLVSSTSPVIQGNDYDANNDGVLDNLPVGFSLIDTVGWSDGDIGDVVYGVVALTQTQGTPDAATRIVNNSSLAVSAWFNGDLYDVGNVPAQLLYDQTRGSVNLPVSPLIASLTPGDTNFVEPTVTTTQLRVASYNIASTSGDGLPQTGLDTILHAIGSEVVAGIARQLDLIALQEVAMQSTTSAAVANLLNSIYGAAIYAYGTLNGASTGSGTQGVVYNSQTLQLLDESAVGISSTTGQPRQTLRHHFQPIGGGASTDFYVYNGHWKSADDADSRNRRLVEAQAIRANADALGNGKNILYVGDFNLYTSSELAFQEIVSAGNGQAIDPVNRIGSWSNNASFLDVLTQAPAFAPPNGLTGGGLDDRFDFQLTSSELTDGLGLDYRPGSYHTFGNNGSVPLNGDINAPASTALGGLANRTTVLNLLTTVSDHLPVVADYTLTSALANPTLLVTSGNKVYDKSTYMATASIAGSNTPTPTLSYVFYSDPSGTSAISPPQNVGTYFVRAYTATNTSNIAAQSSLASFQITAKAITGSITAANKVFDGNTSATILTRSLVGVESGDTVSYVNGTATFDTANVGSSKTVTATGLSLGGVDAGNYSVNATATTTATIMQPAATVAAAFVFYNDSGFETFGGVAAAIDNVGKQLRQSSVASQTTTVANISNYTNGINGLVFDVNNLAATLTAGDFVFRARQNTVLETANPIAWADAPAPIVVNVTQGAPSRIRLEWANNAIQNTWLQVILKANANTGLTTPVVYYVGHGAGEGAGLAPYRVGTAELSAIQSGISSAIRSITDVRDVDKSRRIGTGDLSFLQPLVSSTILLHNITIPIAGSAEEGAPPPSPELGIVLQMNESDEAISGFYATSPATIAPPIDFVQSIDDFFGRVGRKRIRIF